MSSYEDPARTARLIASGMALPPAPWSSSQMEPPPADVSWLRLEPVRRPLLRHRWTVEGRITDTAMRDPFDQPTFRRRRSAERWARRHTCEHITYTVRPVSRCQCGGETHPAPAIPCTHCGTR